ncbi:sodium:proton antiporter [Campylobacter sp. FMV-PI01]|uniref:Sodium:proton antiporter n=1 Tax=Campylobacter portucalensis TaxID=2608384 RepID=A0A6L5WIY0_9BACT|nr:phosphoribosyltransferase family protein [Campylobacter portucalensis]MSN96936.1 sodium:proton antiporter [Campylobacter portucalensis]
MISKSYLSFKNQLEAAKSLYEILPIIEISKTKPILVASSLESIFLVNEIAKILKLSYEILFTEKIYSPINQECLIAMVSETEEIVIIDELVNAFGISLDYVYGEGHRKYEEKILKNIYKYRKGMLIQNFKNKDVILIDKGCETGITVLTCIKSIMNLNPRSISYATPLIANDVALNLNSVIDQIYAVHKISNFVNVDFYYNEKLDLTPGKIISILEESPYYLPLQKEIEGEENAN